MSSCLNACGSSPAVSEALKFAVSGGLLETPIEHRRHWQRFLLSLETAAMGYDLETELPCRAKCSHCRSVGSFCCSTSVTAECWLVGHDTRVVDTDKILWFFFSDQAGPRDGAMRQPVE